MCELLGMNCATPTDINFSFSGFAQRSGITGDHADGFGIAFFEQKACRLFVDIEAACKSPIAQMIRHYPIKSRNVIAHIRKATQGVISLENVHPFMRELWGRHWIFAHNGDLREFYPKLCGTFQPVGTTDSERAACLLFQHLREKFGCHEPAPAQVFEALAEIAPKIAEYGTFNFLLSNGQSLFAFATTKLHWVVREYPFAHAHLVDIDMSIDFSQYTTPEDRVAVIATEPLTDNEQWTAFQRGQLLWFQDGKIERELLTDSSKFAAPTLPSEQPPVTS